MYEVYCEYMHYNYKSMVKLCYMDTDSFVCEIEAEDFYKNTAKDKKTRFNTSGYSNYDNRPLLIGKNEKVIGIMKDELDGKIVIDFVASRTKMYS